MKKIILFIALSAFGRFAHAQIVNPGQVATQDATNRVNTNISGSINDGVNKTEGAIKGLFKKKKKKADSTAVSTTGTSATTGAAGTAGTTGTANTTGATATVNTTGTTAPTNTLNTTGATNGTSAVSNNPSGAQTSPAFRVYNNYDFVPGDTVLFEDHFTDDQDGEFPSHWNLKSGQAVLNKMGTDLAFLLIAGNYAVVSPLIKSPSYLTNNFTVEFDTYANNGYQPMLFLFKQVNNSDDNVNIKVDQNGCQYNVANGSGLSAALPGVIGGDNFLNKWHHIAIAYKNLQIKIYVDQFRVLVIPRAAFPPVNLDVEGIGDQASPIIFKNFRFASGGNMNMLGKKFTGAKIITHGINFDIDKATIKPESLGTLNMVVQVLKTDPTLKFEVDGHTDNTGADAHNLTLSQQRADAVKSQLINMGIDASRLSSKGFGDTKPIDNNSTLEGKANNRRVEFVKI